jgi:hypothetical protein
MTSNPTNASNDLNIDNNKENPEIKNDKAILLNKFLKEFSDSYFPE